MNVSRPGHQEELRKLLTEAGTNATTEMTELARTVGYMGAAILAKTSSEQASALLVVQATEKSKSS